MRKKKIKIDTLTSVSYNPRIISTENLERLKSSINQHTKAVLGSNKGYRLTTTVTINKNGNRIVGGHQRIKALKSLGQDWIDSNDITWIDLIPDSAEEKALNITLNSERFQGNWNRNELDKVLKDILKKDSELFDKLDLTEIDFSKFVNSISTTEYCNKIDNKNKDVNKEKKINEIEENEEDIYEENILLEEEKNRIKEINEIVKNDIEEVIENNYRKDNIEKEHLERLFPLSYAVTGEQRKIILSVIDKAKEKYFLKNSVLSLVKICEEYITIDDRKIL